MAVRLDGKVLGASILGSVKEATSAWVAAGQPPPCLATVLVGDDPASAVYVRNKHRACEEVGFLSRHIALPATASEAEVLDLVAALGRDPAVHGILVQLPLPRGVDADKVLLAIDPKKDVDGFHPENVAAVSLRRSGFVPCTPRGVLRLLDEAGVDPAGRRAVVVGRSNIVGLPVALLLLHRHATVTICHSRTPAAELQAAVEQAEIVVAAVGRPQFVPGSWIRPGAVVIDVGINRVEDGGRSRLVGDVEFEAAAARARAITPVPGGVGPMTIAMLMANTLVAAGGPDVGSTRPR